jgi:molybdate transport system substrate-binding protein
MRKIILCALIAIFQVALTAGSCSAESLTVSAAMSLKNSFEEIGKIYEAKKNMKVLFNFGASGDLARQIEGGAPVDVFAAAAPKDVDALEGKGILVSGARKNFASNAIVLIIPVSSKSSLKSFEGLAAPEIKKIAAGSFKTSPAGRYAEEAFAYYKILPSIKDKLVFGETVRQVLDYTARGEVDAGVVYSTDAMARAKEIKIVAVAPDKSHKPIVYPIAIIKGSKNERAAKAFIDLVVSDEGKKILEKYGFKTVR